MLCVESSNSTSRSLYRGWTAIPTNWEGPGFIEGTGTSISIVACGLP